MALTRSFLKGMGITEEQVSAIIEAHTETTDALKAQRDEYKASAEKLAETEKELNALKGDGNDWQAKYEKEHTDFEAYKTEITTKAVKEAKENAYSQLLKNLGISEKRIDGIIKLTDLSKVEFDENNAIKDPDKVSNEVKTEWAEFIPTQGMQGAGVPTPPGTDGQVIDLGALSMADYIKARTN